MENTYRKIIRNIADSRADHLRRLDDLKTWMGREEQNRRDALQVQVIDLNRQMSVEIELIDKNASVATNRADTIKCRVLSNILEMKPSMNKASIYYQTSTSRKSREINDSDLKDTDSICNEMMHIEASISGEKKRFRMFMKILYYYRTMKKNLNPVVVIYTGIVIFLVVVVIKKCS